MLSTSRFMCGRSASAAEIVAQSSSIIQRALEAAKVFEPTRRAQAEVDREEYIADREVRDGRSSTGRLPGTPSTSPAAPVVIPRYRDDKEAGRRALERHYKSPAYRELHRKFISHTGLGGYGGEAGFEVSPRMYIDPDRPHLKSVYNSNELLSNVRYARFGHFIKELHMIDVDKLYRHARMVPPPTTLLDVMITSRVPLTDRSCAALIRQQGRIISDMDTASHRSYSLKAAKELFERLLLQNLPPADVGVQTHAELIKCAAIVKDWTLGWSVVHQRAVEEMQAHPETFMLTSDYFEAIMQLCASCYKVEEGLEVLHQLLAINLRPTIETLDLAMEVLSFSVTIGLDEQFNTDTDGPFNTNSASNIGGTSFETSDDISANGRRFVADVASAVMAGSNKSLGADAALSLPEELLANILAKADELWTLYEYFDYKPTNASLRNYLKVIASIGQSDRVLAIVEYAHSNSIRMDEETYLWVLFGLRHLKGSARLVSDFIRKMKGSGLCVGEQHHQAALMSFALQGDASAAIEFYRQHLALLIAEKRHGGAGDVTVEMCLYALQAFAFGMGHLLERSTNTKDVEEVLSAAKDIMAYLDRNHSAFDVKGPIYECYFMLCGNATEAVSDAHSMIKKAIAEGCDISPRMLNHTLLANANSPSTGSRHITEEILQMLVAIPTLYATAETFTALDHCKATHGLSSHSDRLWDQLLSESITMGQTAQSELDRVVPRSEGSADQLSDAETERLLASIPSDAPITVPFVPIHAMRKHAVNFHLRVNDIALMRHGQGGGPVNKEARKIKYGSQRGQQKAFEHKGSMEHHI